MDLPLRISVYSFAVAIPALAISVAAGIDQLHREYTVKIKEVLPWMFVANVIGILAATLGTACLFFHFSCRVGIVFLVVGAICTGGWGIYINTLNEANAEVTEQENPRPREEPREASQSRE